MIAILHNVRSQHNVGSILRTAECAGIEKIYLCGFTPLPVDPFQRKRAALVKVSLGAEDLVRWEHVISATRLIKKLKKSGWTIAAIEQDRRSIPYNEYRPRRHAKLALVVGHELQGVPRSILDLADVILEIPLFGAKESLNVAVAFGIIAFELARKLPPHACG